MHDSSDYICLDYIRAREAEVVHLCDTVGEMEHDREFLHLNPKIEMTLQCHRKKNLDTGAYELKKTPWKAVPRRTVGGTQLILRYRKEPQASKGKGRGKGQGSKLVRAAESTEYMRLIGWDDLQWTLQMDTEILAQAGHDFNELCSNFAGNVWSAFHYLPLNLAATAAVGRFGKTGVVDVEDELAVDDGEDDEKKKRADGDDASSSSTDSS